MKKIPKYIKIIRNSSIIYPIMKNINPLVQPPSRASYNPHNFIWKELFNKYLFKIYYVNLKLKLNKITNIISKFIVKFNIKSKIYP